MMLEPVSPAELLPKSPAQIVFIFCTVWVLVERPAAQYCAVDKRKVSIERLHVYMLQTHLTASREPFCTLLCSRLDASSWDAATVAIDMGTVTVTGLPGEDAVGRP